MRLESCVNNEKHTHWSHWPHGQCKGWFWGGCVSLDTWHGCLSDLSRGLYLLSMTFIKNSPRHAWIFQENNRNRDSWRNSSTDFFFTKQVIYSVNVETFWLEFFWGKGWKRQWHATVRSDFHSCRIIVWLSATIKASWKQQFVLESLLYQWNNKPRCVGSAISSVLPPPSYCHFMNMFCISSANLANE